MYLYLLFWSHGRLLLVAYHPMACCLGNWLRVDAGLLGRLFRLPFWAGWRSCEMLVACCRWNLRKSIGMSISLFFFPFVSLKFLHAPKMPMILPRIGTSQPAMFEQKSNIIIVVSRHALANPGGFGPLWRLGLVWSNMKQPAPQRFSTWRSQVLSVKLWAWAFQCPSYSSSIASLGVTPDEKHIIVPRLPILLPHSNTVSISPNLLHWWKSFVALHWSTSRWQLEIQDEVERNIKSWRPRKLDDKNPWETQNKPVSSHVSPSLEAVLALLATTYFWNMPETLHHEKSDVGERHYGLWRSLVEGQLGGAETCWRELLMVLRVNNDLSTKKWWQVDVSGCRSQIGNEDKSSFCRLVSWSLEQ